MPIGVFRFPTNIQALMLTWYAAHFFRTTIWGLTPVLPSYSRRQYRLALRSTDRPEKYPRADICKRRGPWNLDQHYQRLKCLEQHAHSHALPRTPTPLRSKPQISRHLRCVDISHFPSAAISVYPAHFFSWRRNESEFFFVVSLSGFSRSSASFLLRMRVLSSLWLKKKKIEKFSRYVNGKTAMRYPGTRRWHYILTEKKIKKKISTK